jgi:hypothetical protein
MPAILTDKYRTFLAQSFLSSISDGSVHAYLFIGRSTEWFDADNVAVTDTNPPIPVNDVQHIDFDYWRDMLGAKRISTANTALVVPRVSWVDGTVYAQYDDLDTDLFSKSFYVIDDTSLPYRVYKCLWNNKGAASSVAPSTIGASLTPQRTSDSYVWQYMYTIDPDNYKFLSTRWMPVLSDNTVQAVASAASGKLPPAVPLVVIAGGVTYNAVATTTVTLVGDGSGATVTSNGVSIVGGVVTSIQLANGGLGYTQVESINVYQAVANTQASVRAIIPPFPNHGYDPVKELGARALMLVTQFQQDEIGALTVSNDFRRVGLLINPLNANGTLAAASYYRQTTDLTFSANTGVLQPDDVVANLTKTTSPYATVVDVVQVSNNYVVRLTNVNARGETDPFAANDVLQCAESSVEVTVESVSASELTPYTGAIIFVNQRTPVTRDPDQTETIRLVFPFTTCGGD